MESAEQENLFTGVVLAHSGALLESWYNLAVAPRIQFAR
jgi:hypothetical protein